MPDLVVIYFSLFGNFIAFFGSLIYFKLCLSTDVLSYTSSIVFLLVATARWSLIQDDRCSLCVFRVVLLIYYFIFEFTCQ